MMESSIQSYSSASGLVIEDSQSDDYTSVGYVVTDLVDIEPGMEEAFLRCCEWQLEVNRRGKNIQELNQLYNEALATAAIADSRTSMPRYCGDGYQRHRRLSDHPAGTDS